MWCWPREAQPRQQAEADAEEARAAAVEMDEKLQAVTNSDDGRPIHQAHCPFRAYLVCPVGGHPRARVPDGDGGRDRPAGSSRKESVITVGSRRSATGTRRVVFLIGGLLVIR